MRSILSALFAVALLFGTAAVADAGNYPAVIQAQPFAFPVRSFAFAPVYQQQAFDQVAFATSYCQPQIVQQVVAQPVYQQQVFAQPVYQPLLSVQPAFAPSYCQPGYCAPQATIFQPSFSPFFRQRSVFGY